MTARVARGAAAFACLLACAPAARAQVSGYLPLNLSPVLEGRVERLMAMAGRPVMTRPISVDSVRDALGDACDLDRLLCEQVRAALEPWQHAYGLTSAGATLAAASDDARPGIARAQPDMHGEPMDSHWSAHGNAFARYGDHLLLNAGVVGYQGRGAPTGSYVSLGGRYAQLDAGYRDHWWSPMRDSSWLRSTEAPTLPALTLGNPLPMGAGHVRYELFYGWLSRSQDISFGQETIAGRPRLFGFHVSVEPAPGWSLGVSRLLQFGPSPRQVSLKNLWNAFVNPGHYDNVVTSLGTSQEFGNEQSAITSSFTVPGARPIVVYAEYAAEDTFHRESYRFGNSALSAGLFLPRLTDTMSLRYEYSDWQNAWYVHHIYGDGLRNDGLVTGAWMADWRLVPDAVGGQSHSLSLGWDLPSGRTVDARLRTLQNASYSGAGYRRGYDLSLDVTRPWRGLQLGLGLEAGRDEFAARFLRLTGSLQLAPGGGRRAPSPAGPASPGDAGAGDALAAAGRLPPARAARVERFLDLGVRTGQQHYEYDVGGVPRVTHSFGAAHLGLGVRRLYNRHLDLGARLELDNVRGGLQASVRALDLRYRFGERFAATAFLGAARYGAPTVALGWYGGAGLQWRNVAPGWDLALDFNYSDKLQRDKLARGEQAGIWPDAYYTMSTRTLVISRRF